MATTRFYKVQIIPVFVPIEWLDFQSIFFTNTSKKGSSRFFSVSSINYLSHFLLCLKQYSQPDLGLMLLGVTHIFSHHSMYMFATNGYRDESIGRPSY